MSSLGSLSTACRQCGVCAAIERRRHNASVRQGYYVETQARNAGRRDGDGRRGGADCRGSDGPCRKTARLVKVAAPSLRADGDSVLQGGLSRIFAIWGGFSASKVSQYAFTMGQLQPLAQDRHIQLRACCRAFSVYRVCRRTRILSFFASGPFAGIPCLPDVYFARLEVSQKVA